MIMSKESSGIFISNTGSIGGSISVVKGNKNKVEQKVVNLAKSPEKEQLKQSTVISKLTEIEEIISKSALPEDNKRDIATYLSAAKTAVNKDKPKKNLALSNLEEFSTTLETVSTTLDTGKNIWEKVKPILVPIFTWLGGSLM